MEHAFTGSLTELHRLIIHEKTHFLYEHVFDNNLKEEWIDLGGWYKTKESSSGWATTKTTEFVSAYAHAINPDEDMAESVAYYLVNPDKLRSRSPNKYDFIEKNIMHGAKYISVIRPDLTFEVLNLYPDYDYPGKIIRTKVEVFGEPEEDKEIVVEIELNQFEGLYDGAEEAYMRIYHSKYLNYSTAYHDNFFDLRLKPINDNKTILRGTHTLSKHAHSGYWTTDQIVLTDLNGNERFEGQGSINFKMYINNPLEDLIPPTFVDESFNVTVTEKWDNEFNERFFEVLVEFEVIEENIKERKWSTLILPK